MSAYSLIGLRDPEQWGIGAKDNFLSRFGVAMNRGLMQGDATYNLLNKQRSTMARTPYADMADIAKNRAVTAFMQNKTRVELANEMATVCQADPSSKLCAEARARMQGDGRQAFETEPGSGVWGVEPPSDVLGLAARKRTGYDQAQTDDNERSRLLALYPAPQTVVTDDIYDYPAEGINE